MKPILNQQIIDKYVLDEFGKIPNLPTEDEMKGLINNNNLTLERVILWKLFGGDLMIKGQNGRTIIHTASLIGQLDIVQYVLDKGVDVDSLNQFNETPLIYASKCGQIEVINVLLERGSNINHQDNNGWSALHSACNWNQLKVVKVLVEKRIDIQLIGNRYTQNETALDVAKYCGYQQIVKYLTPFFIIITKI